MRRKDREIQNSTDIFDILSRCDTVRIAMQGEQYPYVVPVSFGAEMIDGKPVIYFHCARQGLKVDLLKMNPWVCVEGDIFIRIETTDHGITTRYESVIGLGKCTFVSDPDEIIHGLKVLTEHYGYMGYSLERCRGLEHLYVGKIVLDELTGKRNLPEHHYTFRRAKADEVRSVFSLVENRVHWMDEAGIQQWNVTRYLEAYPMSYYTERQSDGELYVLVSDNRIIGTVVLLDEDERWQDRATDPALYVHNLATLPGEKGAGKTILAEAEQLARAKGKRYVRLDCAVDNVFLNSYYGSLGYRLAGTCEEGFYKGNRREKELTP